MGDEQLDLVEDERLGVVDEAMRERLWLLRHDQRHHDDDGEEGSACAHEQHH